LTFDSLPGVAITVAPISRSHSKRSRDISSGRMAIGVQPRSAQSNAPPLQKLPVDGQTALWLSGSNSPLTSLGTRQPKAAPTLWAPVGKYEPTRPMTRARTPVISGGISRKLTPPYRPVRTSFFQVMRKRFTGSTSQRRTPLKRERTDCGMREGSRSCAKVGITTPRARQRAAVLRTTDGLMLLMIEAMSVLC
jgi:hypothetical protein